MNGYEEPLDSGLIADISKSKALFERKAKLQWEFYSDIAYQRNKIYDLLKSSLRDRAKPFESARWQRVVKYKYALAPLSTNGSLQDPGGRFNIGAIDATRYPMFAALYIASDKGTALAELLGRSTHTTSLTAPEIALTKPDSIAAVSVSGKFEAVLDVRDENNLVGFVDLIKGFRLSPTLLTQAKMVGESLDIVRTSERLVSELCRPDWRVMAMLFDIPGPSQTFGRIVFDAEIEGILYNSVLTGKACLALYPQKFQNSPSYVELDDPAPPEVTEKRLDSTNCKKTI